MAEGKSKRFTALPESNEAWRYSIDQTKKINVGDVALSEKMHHNYMTQLVLSEGDRVRIGLFSKHQHHWGIVRSLIKKTNAKERAQMDVLDHVFKRYHDDPKTAALEDAQFLELMKPEVYIDFLDIEDFRGVQVIALSFRIFSKALLIASSRLANPDGLREDVRCEMLKFIQNGAQPSDRLIEHAESSAYNKLELLREERAEYKMFAPWPTPKLPARSEVFGEALYYVLETLALGGFVKMLDALLQAKPKLDERILALIERPELAESPLILELLVTVAPVVKQASKE